MRNIHSYKCGEGAKLEVILGKLNVGRVCINGSKHGNCKLFLLIHL